MSKSTLKDLKTRRSVRSYKPDQITDEELDLILEAGTWAPTGAGSQSPVIVAVQNKTLINKLQKLNAEVLNNPKAKPFYGAPTVLAVLVDKSKPTPLEDGALVLGNLQNAAWAVGVDSCWIHRAKQVFESEEGKALLKKWKLDSDTYFGVGFCLLGYAKEGPRPKPAARKAGYIIKAK
ncbi:6,7-dihydropteridine reductase [Treponema primitia ZAS-2]|uniref:6,7-dihydropteridine reductase n=1 Tax=Treponema primitia (strain ATCC BAA-887 / DSM 12427 / ZAS-2) TaxID=545694 RepID=F5YMI4_TREPZ|nr:nitroreductase [Treponema primitia]AEF86534.1 6,7-dihydropteridine reductase [Treponema primitia ZAS-2]